MYGFHTTGKNTCQMKDETECGQVQTEQHVVEQCTMSQHLRDIYSYNSLQNLFLENNDHVKAIQFIHRVLGIYK